MYSPAFIASKVASAQDAAAAGRYDIAERKFLGVSSFISFNVAVVKASAGDARGRHLTLRGCCARPVTPRIRRHRRALEQHHRRPCASVDPPRRLPVAGTPLPPQHPSLPLIPHPLPIPPLIFSKTPGEGHVEAAANDFENAVIMCGQLQQAELDSWLTPVRPSVASLTLEVVREETRIKLAQMQVSRVAKHPK
jgi:hypothetical protein